MNNSKRTFFVFIGIYAVISFSILTIILYNYMSDYYGYQDGVLTFENIRNFFAYSDMGIPFLIGSLIILGMATIIFSFLYFFLTRRSRNISKALNNGGEIVNATLYEMEQTLVSVNNNPQVKMTVTFGYNGELKRKEFKAFVDYLQPPRIGSQFDLVYDPVRDKLFSPQFLVK
ncbi:hypothetical protein HZY88_00230 [Aerococcaceae bacterium DSM 111176]|nr:hypothetical protein [Aerococcaceae bacterium DSM 111176]